MKKHILILIFLLASAHVFAITSYTGFIDKFPIELVIDDYSDGVSTAIYVYSNFDSPIPLRGTLKQQKLVLFEKDKSDKNTASLTFEAYDPKSEKLTGIWADLKSNKQLPITLTKAFDMDDNEAWTTREIIQPISLKDRYFKLIVSKNASSDISVTGVKILEKKTDKLLQQINMDCQLWGLNNLSVGDYNFDGLEDFSVFESSYAGPNTSSLYFLFNPKTDKFFQSDFSGTSLEFDDKTKRIHETNQCCAGRSIMNAEYKVVNNKMVLVKQTCLELDDKTQDYKKVKCE